jgi:hypothetical protein
MLSGILSDFCARLQNVINDVHTTKKEKTEATRILKAIKSKK